MIKENDKNPFNGKWKNSYFTVMVKGNFYKSYYNRLPYGKGKITFENGELTLTSTHARKFVFWLPFEEIVSGKYSISNDGLLISGIEGRYKDFNGFWRNKSK